MTTGDTVRHRDGSGSIVLDTSYWPIGVATWIGLPSEELVRKYFREHDTRLLERARKNPPGFILITDATAADQPSAKARKLIADLTNAQPEDVVRLSLAGYLVIDSAIIRGVVTALRWILPRMRDVESVSTMKEALTRSLAVLDQHHVPRPLDLDVNAYRRPSA